MIVNHFNKRVDPLAFIPGIGPPPHERFKMVIYRKEGGKVLYKRLGKMRMKDYEPLVGMEGWLEEDWFPSDVLVKRNDRLCMTFRTERELTEKPSPEDFPAPPPFRDLRLVRAGPSLRSYDGITTISFDAILMESS